MTTQELPLTLQIKKVIFLLVAIGISLLWHSGHEKAFFYGYMIYIAYVFFESDHFNIRFIIGMVAVHFMLVRFSYEFTYFARSLFGESDLSGEFYLRYTIEGVFALILTVAVLNRGRLLAWFNQSFTISRRYRLIGMEWLILLSFFALTLLQFVFMFSLSAEINAMTDYESYGLFLEENANALSVYDGFYIMITMMQLFALQSYNYKRCRRQWFQQF